MSKLQLDPLLLALIAISLGSSALAGTTFTYDTRNTVPFSVAAPGLLANNLGLSVTPLAVKQLNGANTLTGTTALGATITLNADGSFTYNPGPSATLQALAPGQTATDSFTYSLGPTGAVLGGTGMAFMRVAETANYTLVYQLPIPNMAAYNGASVPYSVDNAATVTYPFSRIAYYLELDTGSGIQFAYASMDAFTTEAGRIGVPTTQSGATFQQLVNNLTVVSNAAGVTQGTNLATGNIEFWPINYGQANAINIPGANTGTFDFGDTMSGGGYGSMQIHNYGAAQTIIAYNRWGSGNGGSNSDLGIGNSPSGEPDWTFRSNANSYTVKNMQVLVLPPSATATVTIQVSNHGVSIANISGAEGNAGPTVFPFVATLSQTSNFPVTVDYATANGTATAPGDYTAATGTVTIPAGQLTATIPISVVGDTEFETSETFTVTLSNPTNAALIPTGTTATATILDDERPPTITSALSANGIQGLLFSYTITADGTVPMTFSAQSLPSGLTLIGDTIQGFLSVGSYAVLLTATNSAASDTRTLVINVVPQVPNSDLDQDGFTDEFEIGVGSSPVDPNSTPFTVLRNDGGQLPPGAPPVGVVAKAKPFFVSKLAIKLDFRATALNRDSYTFKGTLPVPATFSSGSQSIGVNLGGITESGALSSKGLYTSSNKRVKIKIGKARGTLAGQNVSIAVSARGSYANALADEGYANTSAQKAPRQVVLFVIAGPLYFTATVNTEYNAVFGQKGSAKLFNPR